MITCDERLGYERFMSDEAIWAMTVEVDQLRGSTRSVSKIQFKGCPPQFTKTGLTSYDIFVVQPAGHLHYGETMRYPNEYNITGGSQQAPLSLHLGNRRLTNAYHCLPYTSSCSFLPRRKRTTSQPSSKTMVFSS